ncbi:hypothetical protein BDV96DRAFT_656398 [Lophiotrema nucula]|uniref:Heterokaryon incompatibility domain-containing protein n=1 Tax=Lophiotrema nucula TaxID=690887 RepID=A0A6A5ZWI6_9PLEO|nr:hypothetical protein BDV96DRAFT_656398 [Lophiotrema nucula]
MNIDFTHRHRLSYRGLEVEWPLRLLHIPSMTSFERNGTCEYLGIERPQYAIITYTWGRFTAPDGGPALPVEGTTWVIPPVHCFSVELFFATIKNIGSRYDWLWLDVACIDQIDEQVKMAEVARQVGIFHGAAEAFAWLHSLDSLVACRSISILAEIGGYDVLGQDHVWDYETEQLRLNLSLNYYRVRLDSVEKALQALIADPWFTSLWTLQESILRRDAQLLSADGEPILYETQEMGDTKQACTIALLNGWCAGIWHDLKYYANGRKLSKAEQVQASTITNLIERVGLNFASAINPNVQYGAARFRETKYPKDRVYGIYGIYRTVFPSSFRLPGPAEVTPDELELFFASALNKFCPWIAQCFVHLAQPRPGHSWCITQDSTVPKSIVYIPEKDITSDPQESGAGTSDPIIIYLTLKLKAIFSKEILCGACNGNSAQSSVVTGNAWDSFSCGMT